MGWDDGVPWAIGGGAEHGAEMARLLAWAAMGGAEGVLTAGALQVQPLAVPGTAIRVLPGPAAIGNRGVNASAEMYLGRLFSQDVVDVTPTPASGARCDLVVARVENPYVDGEQWQYPEDRVHGPYIFTRLIENVAPTCVSVKDLNLGYSAITLARLTIPASTGTITSTMIKDLRTLVNPLTGGVQPPTGGGGDSGGGEGDPVVVTPGGGGDDGDNDTGDPLTSTQTNYLDWPFNAAWDLAIPTWANFADIRIEVQNAQIRGGSLGGFIRAVLDGIFQPEQSFHCQGGSQTTRQTIPLIYSNLPIPADLRGKTVHWKLQHRILSGTGGGKILATPSTRAMCTAKFKQRPDTPA